jgi:MFS family permease
VAGSLGLGAVNFLFTLVAIALIDIVGRRPLLLIGVAGVIISELFLGYVNAFMQASPHTGMLSLYGLLSFIAFFAIGPGVVVWLAISELFPTAMRGKGIALSLFFSSLSGTLLSGCFLQLVQSLGMGKTYWLFAAFGILYFLVAYFFLPETRARSLEEIQAGFVTESV